MNADWIFYRIKIFTCFHRIKIFTCLHSYICIPKFLIKRNSKPSWTLSKCNEVPWKIKCNAEFRKIDHLYKTTNITFYLQDSLHFSNVWLNCLEHKKTLFLNILLLHQNISYKFHKTMYSHLSNNFDISTLHSSFIAVMY